MRRMILNKRPYRAVIEVRISVLERYEKKGLLPYKMSRVPKGIQLNLPYTENVEIVSRSINNFTLEKILNEMETRITKKTLRNIHGKKLD